MLLQTNSYVVPSHLRAEHARLLARFRKAMRRAGCDLFEVYEQIGADWNSAASNGRFVQIMRFRDHAHQQAVREAERLDLEAQSLIEEFCRLINFPYQQERGLFAVGFYTELDSSRIESPGSEEPVEESSHPPKLVSVPETRDADWTGVLDAGMAVDELDIPMEAELLDEEATDCPNDPQSVDRKKSPFYDSNG